MIQILNDFDIANFCSMMEGRESILKEKDRLYLVVDEFLIFLLRMLGTWSSKDKSTAC
jgi:hypothetical protein